MKNDLKNLEITKTGIGMFYAKLLGWKSSICEYTDEPTYEVFFEISRSNDSVTVGDIILGEFLGDSWGLDFREHCAPNLHRLLMTIGNNYPRYKSVTRALNDGIGKEFIVKVERETRNGNYWEGVTEVIKLPQEYHAA